MHAVCRLFLLLSLSSSWLLPLLPAQAVEVEGSGPTEAAAIEAALLQAIRQNVGVVTEDRQSERHVQFMAAGLHHAFAASRDEAERRERIATATKGMVQGYTVQARAQDGDQVRVTVAAKVVKFDPQRLRDEPFTVVLLPVRHQPGVAVEEVDGKRSETRLDLGPLAQQLATIWQTQLVQSRQFQVLDRQDLGLADAELGRILKGECPPQDLVRLRQRLSADYLLLGEIAEATAQVEAIALGGLGFSGRAGHVFALRYTVLEVPTGRVVRTGTVTSRDWPAQRTAIPSTRLDLDGLFRQVAARLSPLVTDAFLDDLSPIYVAKVADQDGTLLATLTQGGSRFAKGDRFVAVQPGEPITHPVTGAVLAAEETVVGELLVVDVAGKLAVAQVTGGGAKVQRGALVRRQLPAGVTVQ